MSHLLVSLQVLKGLVYEALKFLELVRNEMRLSEMSIPLSNGYWCLTGMSEFEDLLEGSNRS